MNLITRNKILGLVAVLSGLFLMFSLGLLDIFWDRTYGVEKENARREIFEHSNAHVRGKESDILKLYNEYRMKKTDSEKAEVMVVVRMMTKDFNESLLNSNELRDFVKSCKYN